MKDYVRACGMTLLMALLHPITVANAGSYNPQPGQVHPDFVLPRIDTGEPVRLADLRGRRVLLMHFASW